MGKRKKLSAAIEEGDRPIATKLLTAIGRQPQGWVVDIKKLIAAGAAADRGEPSRAGLHPAHAAYVLVQNRMSLLSEQLTALAEMAPFVDLVAQAEDLYLPQGPPISPLTVSYFTSWAFFDACIGRAVETIGTCVLGVAAALGMDEGLTRLLRLMQGSRMGIYVHEGASDNHVTLRDLVTGVACRTIVPAGYGGQKGELWFVRVLPPPIPECAEHVAFTTPYVLVKPEADAWQAYFGRTLPGAPEKARLAAYERHLKYGPTRTYWNAFVFESYSNHQPGAIFLTGLPDIAESRPHSRVNA